MKSRRGESHRGAQSVGRSKHPSKLCFHTRTRPRPGRPDQALSWRKADRAKPGRMDGRSGLPSPPLASSHRDRTHPSPPVRALATTTTGTRRKPRGFAFVEFYNPDDAEEARVKLDKTDVHGREIQVMFAQNRRKRPEEMSTMDR